MLTTTQMAMTAGPMLTASAVRLTYLAMFDPIEAGGKLGQMASSAILGVVCVALVIALVRVFALKERATTLDFQARDKYLADHAALVKDTATAAQRATDMGVSVVAMLDKVEIAMRESSEASRAVCKVIEKCDRNR